MRSAQISFKNKNIVIVGGGKQAAKKVKMFLEEGANVTVVAPIFDESIPKEICRKKRYEKDDINTAFMVYACTDDTVLNHQVVMDANEKQCLSASVHKDEEATYHPLQSTNYENMHLALSTNGAFPALLKEMQDTFVKIYKKTYHQHLGNLRYIREYILSMDLTLIERSKLLKEIATLPQAQVKFYKEAIEKQKAVVFVFHGNDDEESTQWIEKMVDTISDASYYAFIHENAKVSLTRVQQHLSLLAIRDIVYQPMFLTDGYCYKKVCAQLSKTEDLLLNDTNIYKILKSYSDCKQGLIVVHDTKERHFYNCIQKHLPEHMKVITLSDALPTFNKEEEILLSGMFLLKGKHFKEDVFYELYSKLISEGYKVKKNPKTLMEMPDFLEIIYEKYTKKM